MILLNSKSIVDCEDYEEEHNNEIFRIANTIIDTLPDYDCVVSISYIDDVDNGENKKNLNCSLHDFLSMVEYVDFKNGLDIVIGDNNVLSLVAYGQYYEINNQLYYMKSIINILPYVGEFEFLDISTAIINMKNDLIDYQMKMN